MHDLSSDIRGQIGIYDDTINLMANPKLEKEFEAKKQDATSNSRYNNYSTNYDSNYNMMALKSPVTSNNAFNTPINRQETYNSTITILW